MSSDYQVHSKLYYKTVGVATYKTVTGTPERIAAEHNEQRYTNTNISGIHNLNYLIESLRNLVGSTPNPKGIDYGCGAHFFVHQCAQWGWDVLGFDVVAEQIELAHQQYPDSANRYRCHDLLADGIPVADASQDFIFCNAVFQHFSSSELTKVLGDMKRVLKDSGVLLAIFKTKIADYTAFQRETSIDIHSVDIDEGKVMVDDPLLNKVLTGLSVDERKKITAQLKTERRLFHLYDVDELLDQARAIGLEVVDEVELANGVKTRGVVTYRSGRGIPSAAIFCYKVS